jgi:hypothetical protein
MLPAEALRSVRLILVHDDCPDGLASAILLRDVLEDAELRFLQYGTDAHRQLDPQPGMLFCDFSPHPDRVLEFARVGTIVLDHHRTARRIVEAMGDRGVFGDESTDLGVCGAVLAYRHVWRPLRRESSLASFAEDFAAVAGVRDTWRRSDPRWLEGCAQAQLLTMLPRDWWLRQPLAGIARTWGTKLEPVGHLLYERKQDDVRGAVLAAHRFTTKGVRVVVLDGSSLASDACEVLGNEADVVVGFDYQSSHSGAHMRVSLRSYGSFDCASFASVRGGGGHTHAAGFSIALRAMDPQPFQHVENMFADKPR